ncbi:MAG: hypothetical protein ACYC0C_14540 [Devosia sp.]
MTKVPKTIRKIAGDARLDTAPQFAVGPGIALNAGVHLWYPAPSSRIMVQGAEKLKRRTPALVEAL